MGKIEIEKMPPHISVQANLEVAVSASLSAALRIIEQLDSSAKYEESCDWILFEYE
ncbi:hypothetical protein MADE_1014710 [Alteromonas mediterranea DE]|uniref:Uncharacterized protein n=1 Tax=Alteromonas mediterranea (strain DSM 17117 / CIP 110805 / LMG 28347 / Deep ecotype) TaxID=1774373 RepID=F2GCC0_ALTMD|nr:hypothetical protein MADE_1014710 [Alteromonas mediterranea DE]